MKGSANIELSQKPRFDVHENHELFYVKLHLLCLRIQHFFNIKLSTVRVSETKRFARDKKY